MHTAHHVTTLFLEVDELLFQVLLRVETTLLVATLLSTIVHYCLNF